MIVNNYLCRWPSAPAAPPPWGRTLWDTPLNRLPYTIFPFTQFIFHTQQIIRLSGLPIRLCEAVGPALWVMDHANLLHYAVDRALTGDGDALRLLQQQRLVHPSAPVSIIADILVVNLSHSLRQTLILPGSLPMGDPGKIPADSPSAPGSTSISFLSSRRHPSFLQETSFAVLC